MKMKQKRQFQRIITVILCVNFYCLFSFLFAEVKETYSVSSKLFDNSIELEVVFPEDKISLVRDGTYSHVGHKELTMTNDPAGYPKLPARLINVLLPSGARFLEVEAYGEEGIIADSVMLYPVQPSIPGSEAREAFGFVEPNPTVYDSNQMFPSELAEFKGEQRIRGYNTVSIRINPVRYKPASRDLYFTGHMTIIVHYEVAGEASSTKILSKRPNKIFRNAVKKLTVNGAMLEDEPFFQSVEGAQDVVDEDAGEVVDYLVITAERLVSAFSYLASYRAWWNGFKTEIVTIETINSTYSGVDLQARIRACIIDYYQNHNTTFVVLGGDNTVVPDRDCYVGVNEAYGPDYHVEEHYMPTDLYYAGLDSDWDEDGDGVYGEADYNAEGDDEGDLGPDVMLGRIPGLTWNHGTSYRDRVEIFERIVDSSRPHDPPSELLDKILLLGEHMGSNASTPYSPYSLVDSPSDSTSDGLPGFQRHSPVSDAEMWTRRLYRDAIQPKWQPGSLGMFFDTVTSWDGSLAGDYEQNFANVSSILDEGWCHLFMETHGSETSWSLEDGNFSIEYDTQLNNFQFIVYTTACSTGMFDGVSDPCLGEAFLRTQGQVGGSVAYFGSSRLGWYTPDPPAASNTSRGGPSMEYAYAFYDEVFKETDAPVYLGEAFYLHKLSRMGFASNNTSADRWLQFGLNYLGDPAITLYGAGIPAVEYEALEALYNSTDGDNWINATNWFTSKRAGSWYGVNTYYNHVTNLYLSRNGLSGTISPGIENLPYLTSINFDDNNLTGSIPVELGNLTGLKKLNLELNSLSGSIPSTLGNLRHLESLDLSDNELTGLIPPELGIGGIIWYIDKIDISHNNLSGIIPSEFGNFEFILDLDLSYNQLTGSIPPELGNCDWLAYLRLNNNKLSGSIPPEIGFNHIYNNCRVLDLSSNFLTGVIPFEIGNLRSLEYLYLNSNRLTGPIPPELGLLKYLIELDLSHNNLTGRIPYWDLEELTRLVYLNFSHNHLKGTIPSTFSELTSLNTILLDHNELYGDLPAFLADPPAIIDLSYNHLEESDPAVLAIIEDRHGGEFLSTQSPLPLYGSVGVYDFDKDGNTDILWRNVVSGANLIWLMNGVDKEQSIWLDPLNVDWDLKGAADFDGDNSLDLLWHNRKTGENLSWLLDGTTKIGEVDYPASTTQYIIESLSDLDNDGCADLFFRNNETGSNMVWLLDGSGRKEKRWFPNLSTEWKIMSVADFNWDGYPDILWQNVLTGMSMFWTMDGFSKTSKVWLTKTAPEWDLNLCDFDGNGAQDFMWHNQITGANMLWGMVDTERDPTYWREWLNKTDNEWLYAVNSDFYESGYPGILWHNRETGANMLWEMWDFRQWGNINRVWIKSMADTDFKLISKVDSASGYSVFSEDFSDGFSGWSDVYSPTNYIVDIYGRKGVFYNNETSRQWSGIVTDGLIGTYPGLVIEADFYAHVETGCIATLQLCLTQKDGTTEFDSFELASIEASSSSNMTNSWRTVRIAIQDDYFFKLYLDGVYLGTNTEPIPEEYRDESFFWIRCSASDEDGSRVYLDGIEVRE